MKESLTLCQSDSFPPQRKFLVPGVTEQHLVWVSSKLWGNRAIDVSCI